MFRRWYAVLLSVLLSCGAQAATHARLVGVPFSAVQIQDDFWTPRQRINREVVLPTCFAHCEKTGRISNFAKAGGLMKGEFEGIYFNDSDVYKVLEGAAYSLHLERDPKLEATVDGVIAKMAAAQQPNGYLNTYYTLREPTKKWTNLAVRHELYCAGHLFEAAVAHTRATGKKTLLDVAVRFADRIDQIFGPDKRHDVPGHEEIELALIKLADVTGQERYRKLAEFFVRIRGDKTQRPRLYGPYCQDHLPVSQQTEPVGHAVRAMYLYSAVADVAALTGDASYITALERLWHNVVKTKMYITGGIGSTRHGEAFGKPYELPNDTAYCETCAAIGMLLWNHRLYLLHGDGRFADIAEREMYNGFLAGVSLSGDRFFYVNPLASRGNHHRQAWYGCACCPTNVVRVLPSIGGYVYAATADGTEARVAHYVAGKGTVPLKDGKVTLVQRTGYPWDGGVQIIVEPEGASDFAVGLRIPGWCEKFALKVDGKPLDAKPQKGFVSIRRAWRSGTVIQLDLDMPVRQVAAHPKVKNNAGRLALMRGPIVYCLEDADHTVPVDQIAIPRGARLAAAMQADLLGGVVAIEGQGVGAARPDTMAELRHPKPRPVTVKAVPYYAWDNRTPGRMVVWVPEKPSALPSMGDATVAALGRPSASHCHGADAPAALNDGTLPKNSNDHDIPRFTWWDHRGTQEWAQLSFARPQKLSKAEVYWFDDTGRGQCRVPQTWRLLVKAGDGWKPVADASAFGVDRDKLNVVAFQPVTTTAVRIEVQLRPKFSGGILEWRLPE